MSRIPSDSEGQTKVNKCEHKNKYADVSLHHLLQQPISLARTEFDPQCEYHVSFLDQLYQTLVARGIIKRKENEKNNDQNVSQTTKKCLQESEENVTKPEAVKIENICNCEDWVQIGFQSKTPFTDFRSMGLLAPWLMNYMVEYYPEKTKEYILNRSYPFACTVISIGSCVLKRILPLFQEKKVSKNQSAHYHGMILLMEKEKQSDDFESRCVRKRNDSTSIQRICMIEELFIIFFDSFDCLWQKYNAHKTYIESYFSFGKILSKTEDIISQNLEKNPLNFKVFKYLIGFDLEDQ